MERVVEYTIEAKDDFLFFKKAGLNSKLKKIRKLIESIKDDPFEGIGKPEPLKHDLAGCWSRRIDAEH